MADFGLTMKATYFFTSEKVMKEVRKANKVALMRTSHDVKRAAKRSIKTRRPTKKQWELVSHPNPEIRAKARRKIEAKFRDSSSPGSPPYHHGSGSGGIKAIFNAWDPTLKTAVVGPLRFNQEGGIVPRLLEFGGTVRRRVIKGTRIPAGRRRRGTTVVTMRYRKRPTMRLALLKVAPKMAKYWRGSVSG